MRSSHDRNRLIRRARHLAPPTTARLTLAVSLMVTGCATLDQPAAREASRDVPDAFAADFSVRLYASGESAPADAARSAQLALAHDRPTSEWSAFRVLVP